MVKSEELVKILEYKKLLESFYGKDENEKSITHFKEILLSKASIESFNDLNPSKKNKDFKYYLYASIMSLFLERNGYDLKHWDYFFTEVYVDLIKNGFPTLTKELPKKIENTSGQSRILELFVGHSINRVFNLNKNNIFALYADSKKPTTLFDDTGKPFFPAEFSDTEQKILKKIKITMKIRGSEEKKVWGDNDVVVITYPEDIKEAEAFCLISCKTSSRERAYQSIFWATHSRIEGIGKHIFVTLDKGDSNGNSEIGNRSDDASRKLRNALESTMERVYVFRNSKEVERSAVIKDFDYLKKDLLRWKDDFLGL